MPLAPLGQLPPPPVSNPYVTVDPSQMPQITPVPLNPDQLALSGGQTLTLPNFSPDGLPELPDSEKLEPNLAKLEPTPPPPQTSHTIPQAAIDRLRELQRQKTENPGTTLDPGLPQQAQDWLARAGANAPKKLILEGYPYPKAACPTKGYATVTTSVNAQGQVIRSEITNSSGSSDLDEVALKFAKAYSYPNPQDGQPKTYWSPFDFDPSIACGSKSPASPAESNKTQPAKSPSSSTTPPVAPKATPVPSSKPEAPPAPETSPAPSNSEPFKPVKEATPDQPQNPVESSAPATVPEAPPSSTSPSPASESTPTGK